MVALADLRIHGIRDLERERLPVPAYLAFAKVAMSFEQGKCTLEVVQHMRFQCLVRIVHGQARSSSGMNTYSKPLSAVRAKSTGSKRILPGIHNTFQMGVFQPVGPLSSMGLGVGNTQVYQM